MDIQFITYKEKQYPVRISYFVLKHLRAKTGKDIDGIIDDMAAYESLLYLALKSGAKYSGTDLDLKEEQMEDVLDECFFDFLSIIPTFFPEFKKKQTEQQPKQPTKQVKK